MKNVVIFENRLDDFELLSNFVSKAGCQPYPVNWRENLILLEKIKWLLASYLNGKDDFQEKRAEITAELTQANPTAFLLDFALVRDERNADDQSGGILKKILLKPYFESIPIVFISDYSRSWITGSGYYDKVQDKFFPKYILRNRQFQANIMGLRLTMEAFQNTI